MWSGLMSRWLIVHRNTIYKEAEMDLLLVALTRIIDLYITIHNIVYIYTHKLMVCTLIILRSSFTANVSYLNSSEDMRRVLETLRIKLDMRPSRNLRPVLLASCLLQHTQLSVWLWISISVWHWSCTMIQQKHCSGTSAHYTGIQRGSRKKERQTELKSRRDSELNDLAGTALVSRQKFSLSLLFLLLLSGSAACTPLFSSFLSSFLSLPISRWGCEPSEHLR